MAIHIDKIYKHLESRLMVSQFNLPCVISSKAVPITSIIFVFVVLF